MMSRFRGMVRGFCTVVAGSGFGLGNAAVSVRFTPVAGQEANLKDWLAREVLPAMVSRQGMASVHLLQPAPPPPMTPAILILTPVLMPVIRAAGIDPVYFGVLFIINNSIGLVTPPVGTVLNVVAGVGRISMDDVTRGVIPFMVAEFTVMFLMVAFPALVTAPARWLIG